MLTVSFSPGNARSLSSETDSMMVNREEARPEDDTTDSTVEFLSWHATIPSPARQTVEGSHHSNKHLKHVKTEKQIHQSKNENMMVAKKVKKHVCSYCEKAFDRKAYVKNHIDAKHIRAYQYPCTNANCSKIYTNRKALYNHSKICSLINRA